MEASEFPYDELDDFCLAQEECVEPLINDAAADCIYCRLELMDDEDWD